MSTIIFKKVASWRNVTYAFGISIQILYALNYNVCFVLFHVQLFTMIGLNLHFLLVHARIIFKLLKSPTLNLTEIETWMKAYIDN